MPSIGSVIREIGFEIDTFWEKNKGFCMEKQMAACQVERISFRGFKANADFEPRYFIFTE